MIELSELRKLIEDGESLTVEFKGEERTPLSDNDLIETVVCLANGQGGTLLIGVEDDGRATGLHPTHRTRPELLSAFIANRTVPPLSVEVSFATLPEGPVAVVEVPASSHAVATSNGRMLIRYLDPHGSPGCRPLYPHELMSWRADRGQADLTALPVPDATWDDLDQLEFARLRRLVEEHRGDVALLELSDEEIAGALGLVHVEGNELTPTLAGLLLVGKEAALRKHVPAHEVAFQVLRGTNVAVNEFRRWPLLRVFEWLMQALEVRNEEEELMVDGFRVGVPRYDPRGVREAMNNALIHRDYGLLGAVHVQLHDDYALVSNPGGFVAGVHVDNLLVVAPRPRNPLLADAFKRIGLVERTGRGISIIYAGQLRNGRRPPSYDRSTEVSVDVALNSGPSDLKFVKSTIQAHKRLGRVLTVPELLVLWELWTSGRVSVTGVALLIQRDQRTTQDLLRELQQADLIIRFSSGGQYFYRLGPGVRGEDGPDGPIEAGPSISALSTTQVEEQIMAHVHQHGCIQRGDVEAMSNLSRDQAYRLLKRLVEQGKLEQVGRGRAAHYRLATPTSKDRSQ